MRTPVEMGADGRHELFLEEMKGNSSKKMRAGMISHNCAYVHTFNIKRGTSGTIFEVRCPELQEISVFGESPAISLRCFDKDNREPDPATRMNFKIVSARGSVSRKCRATYANLSAKAIKYSFPDGLYLSSNEALVLEVLNPDIDLERIELSMDADIFDTSGQAC